MEKKHPFSAFKSHNAGISSVPSWLTVAGWLRVEEGDPAEQEGVGSAENVGSQIYMVRGAW